MRSLLLAIVLSSLPALPAQAVLTWPWFAAPCNGTLQACIDAAAPGEIVEVAISTPIEETISFEKSLTLRGVVNDNTLPVFAPSHSVFAATPASGDHVIVIADLILDGGSITVAHGTTGSAEIVVSGNRMVSGSEGIRIVTGTGGDPRGPVVLDVASNKLELPDGSGERYGILLDLSMATQVTAAIRRNEVHLIGQDQGAAIQLANGDASMSLAVTNNLVWGSAYDRGIFVYQYAAGGSIDAVVANNLVMGATIGEGRTGTGIAVYGSLGSLDIEAVNNTAAGNEVGLSVGGRPDLGATVTGLVANNAFTDDSVYGFDIETALWGSVANRNNLDAGNGVSGEGPTYDPGPGTVTAAALLDAASFYQPLPGSPVRDAGDSSAVPSAVALDFLGNPRIQGAAVDIGVYELPEPGAGAAALAALASLATLSRTGYRRSRRQRREDAWAATA